MKLSTKAQYALEALVELQLQEGSAQNNLPSIAARRGLSEPYLEQIFATLRRAGIVRSVRGAQGGYRLAADPAKLTAGSVIRALEGPLHPVKCISCESANTCPLRDMCPTRPLWAQVAQAMDAAADSVTLEDLARDARGQAYEPEYYI